MTICKQMIIVKIIGGLGNQMFQYAVARRLSYLLNVPFKLDITAYTDYELHDYGLKNFNIIEEIASQKEILRLKGRGRLLRLRRICEEFFLPYHKRTYIRERSMGFDADILKLRGEVYLDGYWQAEAYFKEIENLIRNEFTLRSGFSEESQKILQEMQNSNSICLHVRRGDYVSNPTTNMFHGVLSIDYYSRAIAIIADRLVNPHFYVFSDDQDWAKKNIRISHPVKYVVHNGRNRNYEDLMLMSNCKHFIIANSTFSWWGAWLSNYHDKIVFAPKNWVDFRTKHFDMSCLIPYNWITL